MISPRFFLSACALIFSTIIVVAAAPTDSPRDADIAQSSYLGGAHNIAPETLPQFKQLWNASFGPD